MIEKCKCQHCDTRIEFEIEHLGETVDCPNCKMPTMLFIPAKSVPPPEFSFPKNELKKSNTVMMFSIAVPTTIAAIVIVGLLIKNGNPTIIEKEKIVYVTNSPSPAISIFPKQEDFGDGLSVETSRVGYVDARGKSALGKLVNTHPFALKYVLLELNELDRSGNVVGSVMDSISGLNPGETWNFKMSVSERCDSVRVARITAYKSENSGN